VLEFDLPMAVSAIVLVATFFGIFTEKMHGLDRAKFGLAGAVAMIVAGQATGFYDTRQALAAIDWNVILLLLFMMTIVAIMLPTGGFQRLALRIGEFSRGRPYLLLVMIGTAVTVISLLLDNVTTVVIFGPLVVLIAHASGKSPVPILLTIALLSDTGGIATLVGDPPNIMIGSAAGIDFNTFVLRMGGVVFVAWLAVLIAMRFAFREDLAVPGQEARFEAAQTLDDPRTWNIALGALALMVVLFVLHHQFDWEPWFVALAGLTTILVLARHVELSEAFEQVELGLLLFFASLFIVVGGVEHSGLLRYLGQQFVPLVQEDLLTATLVLLWIAALVSALIDNIPFTVAMIPIIQSVEATGVNVTPLWWALSAGVGLGGNGTHIGSTANVYIVTLSERIARERNDPSLAITPGLWFRKGTPAMLLTLVTTTIVMWLFFDFFAKPIH
jgi:Na+/H+ antiporter NhaD/arsenite permease-like protein